MQVILLEKLVNRGEFGDIVNVRAGYARNCLLPEGKALPASKDNLKYFTERKLHLQKMSQDESERLQARAQELSEVNLIIEAQTDPDGRLFGSVGSRDVMKAAQRAGIELKRSEVLINADNRIRQTGEYKIPIRFRHGIEAEALVHVKAANLKNSETKVPPTQTKTEAQAETQSES